MFQFIRSSVINLNSDLQDQAVFCSAYPVGRRQYRSHKQVLVLKQTVLFHSKIQASVFSALRNKATISTEDCKNTACKNHHVRI